MIKTLRKKFIFTSMVAVTILLIVLIGTTNILHISLNNSMSDRMLERISDLSYEFPPKPPTIDKTKPENFLSFPQISKDNEMAARFFIVTLDNNGNILRAHTDRISAVSNDEAEKMAKEVYKKNKTKGNIDNFKFIIKETDKNERIIIFLDDSNSMNSIVSVLAISLIIGLICWILMFILVYILSHRAIKPIAENIEKQKSFVSNAGHEIKTPLAIIQSNTEAMELYNGENKWTVNIKNQVERLNKLTQNLLMLSKMDEPNLNLPSEPFSLNEMTNEILKEFTEIINSKNITINCKLNKSTVKSNKDSVANLIYILLDNATKYTDENGSIDVETPNNGILKITNSFAEKPADDPEKLFERFYRGFEARTQSTGGCGIGLSAAKAIADANNAAINAEYIDDTHILFTVIFSN